jgi:hypothetical protein
MVMGIMARLRRLDQRADPHLRQEGETAEAYLRRAPGFIWLRNTDLGRALVEHFAALDAQKH